MLLNPEYIHYVPLHGLYLYIPEKREIKFYSHKKGNTFTFTTITRTLAQKEGDYDNLVFKCPFKILFISYISYINIWSIITNQQFLDFFNTERLTDVKRKYNQNIKMVDYIIVKKQTFDTLNTSPPPIEHRIVRIDWGINQLNYYGDTNDSEDIYEYKFPLATCTITYENTKNKWNMYNTYDIQTIKDARVKLKLLDEFHKFIKQLDDKYITTIHDFSIKTVPENSLYQEAVKIGLVDNTKEFNTILQSFNMSQYTPSIEKKVKENGFDITHSLFRKAQELKAEHLYLETPSPGTTGTFFESDGNAIYIKTLPIQLTTEKQSILNIPISNKKCGGSNCFTIYTFNDIEYGIRHGYKMFAVDDINLYNNIIEIVINLVLYMLYKTVKRTDDITNLYIPHIHEISHFGLIKHKEQKKNTPDRFIYIPYTVSINKKNDDNIHDYFKKKLQQDPAEVKQIEPTHTTESTTNTTTFINTTDITAESPIIISTWTPDDINIFIYTLCINILYFLLYTYIKLNLTHNDLKLNNIVISTNDNDKITKIYIIDFGETIIRFVYDNKVYLFGKYNDPHVHKYIRKQISVSPEIKSNYFWYTSYFISRPQFVDCDIYYFLISLYAMEHLHIGYKNNTTNTSLQNYNESIKTFLNQFMLIIFHNEDAESNKIHLNTTPRTLLYTLLTDNKIEHKNLLLFRLYELLQILKTSEQKEITDLLSSNTTIFDGNTINQVLEHQKETYETISKKNNIIFTIENIPYEQNFTYYGKKSTKLYAETHVGGHKNIKKTNKKDLIHKKTIKLHNTHKRHTHKKTKQYSMRNNTYKHNTHKHKQKKL